MPRAVCAKLIGTMICEAAFTSFRKNLTGWFHEYRRDLPWRRTKDPYRIWLSEVMLQQTRVAVVIPFYERFLERFPTAQELADAPEQEVLRLWAGLGYYSRARNLQKAARQIVADHGGRFPDGREETLKLAGIGDYTSAAVLSIAYGKPLAVLDGNVARVLARIAGMRGDLRAGGRWQKLQHWADELLDPADPGEWNEAMMELGATVCTPRSPQCLVCPVAEFCAARMEGSTEAIPEKRKKSQRVDITLAALVLVDARQFTLLLQPPKSKADLRTNYDVTGLLSRMWHFPTIRVRRDAARELSHFVRRQIYGGRAIQPKLLAVREVRHTVTYRSITVEAFRMEVKKLPSLPGARKLPLCDLGSVPISNLTRKVAQAALLPTAKESQVLPNHSPVLRF